MRGWDCRASLPHLPFLTTIVRRQELAPNRERGAYESLAWLPWLRRACPSATLDKQSVFSCRATIANPRRRAQACVSMYTDLVIFLCRALAVHDFRRELGRLGQIDVVGRYRVLGRQLLQVGERETDALDADASEEGGRRFSVISF